VAQSSLAYAGVVTILGMGVVFSFLALLSAGMMGLRRFSRAAGAVDGGTAARHDAPWVAAAVAAYLAGTGELGEVSAAPWDPARRHW
jgi:Na+-transporting methylmalonyl-CoA/oxaloacetate decarboxylase gamma subunit